MAARLVVTIQKFICDLPSGGLVCQLNCRGAEPLNRDNRHQGVGENTLDRRVGEQSFQLAHENKGDIAVDSSNCKADLVVQRERL
jgi:hypothetical protein